MDCVQRMHWRQRVCTHDFLAIGLAAFKLKLKRRRYFRTGLKALKRVTRGSGKDNIAGAHLNVLLRGACRRYAFLAILTFGIPSVIRFYGINAVEKQQMALSFDTVAKMTQVSPKESLAKALLPSAIAALGPMLGAGLGATRLIGQRTQANRMTDKCEQLQAAIDQLDTSDLIEPDHILRGPLLQHAETTQGVVFRMSRSNITDVMGNKGQTGENHQQAKQLTFAVGRAKPKTDAGLNVVARAKSFSYLGAGSAVSDVFYYLKHWWQHSMGYFYLWLIQNKHWLLKAVLG